MKTLYTIPLQNKLETSLKLLDALIMPVLTYCSEIWGHQLIKEPNNFVNKFSDLVELHQMLLQKQN
jgi:hypothetical protein